MARIYLSPPELTGHEVAMLTDAVASGWIAPLGPQVDGFEADVCRKLEVGHALALSSGTAALHLALLALGVGAGDSVWTSTLTFAAAANAIAYVGATPVFVDSERASWNIDPALLADELHQAARQGTLPKAVIAVDLYGQCADLQPIADACRRHDVWLIEDAAEALGATYRDRPAGSFGDLSILSFNGNKIITTSGGGMLLGNRVDWINRARHLATQAREPVLHYEHKDVGYNYRMSNLLAAVGRAQFADLDRRVDGRRRLNARYREALAARGWQFMPEASYGRATFWLTCATVGSTAARDRTIARLAAHDIEARPVWKPMHLQPAFTGCRAIGGAVAEDLFATGLCLPSSAAMTDESFERIVTAIRAS